MNNVAFPCQSRYASHDWALLCYLAARVPWNRTPALVVKTTRLSAIQRARHQVSDAVRSDRQPCTQSACMVSPSAQSSKPSCVRPSRKLKYQNLEECLVT